MVTTTTSGWRLERTPDAEQPSEANVLFKPHANGGWTKDDTEGAHHAANEDGLVTPNHGERPLVRNARHQLCSPVTFCQTRCRSPARPLS